MPMPESQKETIEEYGMITSHDYHHNTYTGPSDLSSISPFLSLSHSYIQSHNTGTLAYTNVNIH